MSSVFSDLAQQAWPYRYKGQLHVATLCGGIPADEKTVLGWINAKLKDTRSASEIEELVLQTMADRSSELGRPFTQDEAVQEVAMSMVGKNGFKQDAHGLFVEGRQLKSALKEAVSVAVAGGKLEKGGWGKTNKGLLSYFAEHVFVPEEKLYLMRSGEHVDKADGTMQKMVHTWRGDAISYEDYVKDVDLGFTVMTDHRFTRDQWGAIWLTGEMQGIGASRSQGFGRYEITAWDEEDAPRPQRRARS